MLSLSWSELGLFVSVAAILVFTPGANTLYIVANSIEGGKMAGIITSMGVQLGTLVHIAIAAIGVGALLASSIWAFNVVKYLGAAYLIYLGLQTIRSGDGPETSRDSANWGVGRHFYQGFLVQTLNPKTILFMLAFLPQFVDPKTHAVTAQFISLGLILVVLGTISDVLYAVTTAAVGGRLQRKLSFLGAKRYWIGGIYVGLGLLTAMSTVSAVST